MWNCTFVLNFSEHRKSGWKRNRLNGKRSGTGRIFERNIHFQATENKRRVMATDRGAWEEPAHFDFSCFVVYFLVLLVTGLFSSFFFDSFVDLRGWRNKSDDILTERVLWSLSTGLQMERTAEKTRGTFSDLILPLVKWFDPRFFERIPKWAWRKP